MAAPAGWRPLSKAEWDELGWLVGLTNEEIGYDEALENHGELMWRETGLRDRAFNTDRHCLAIVNSAGEDLRRAKGEQV